MLRATFKSLMSRKARLLLSGIAVILGVTFVSGALVLNASMGATVESMFTTVFDNVDVQVTGKQDDESGSPAAIPADVVGKVKDVPGVKDASGLVQDASGRVQVVGKNGKVPPMAGPPTIGQAWVDPADPVELRDGRGPKTDDEIVINAGLAKSTGYGIGDTIPLVISGSPKVDYTVVGIIGYSGGRDSLAGEQTIEFTLDAARANLMTEPDSFTTIDVKAGSGVSDDKLRDDVAAAVGSGYKVQTGQDLADAQASVFKEILNFFNYLLLGFGAVALIVSIFLIINTFSIIVAQRTRELALFRAMGAGRGQVTGSVLLEALVIGLFSGIIGLGLGIGIGYLGTFALGSQVDTETSLRVPISAGIAALAVGVGVTVLAALVPAISASRIPPIAAMRAAASTSRPVRWFAIFGGVILAGGGGLMWSGLSGQAGDGTKQLATVGAAGALLFIGSVVITPVIARPIVSAIGMVMSWSLPGKLGRRNSGRNPRRTAITASALMIGIAMVTTVGVLLSSAQASMNKYFETTISADILITGQPTGAEPASFDAALLPEIRKISGVDAAAGTYFTGGEIGSKSIYMTLVDDAPAFIDMMGEKVSKGSLSNLGADEVAIYKGTAEKRHLKVGDVVNIKIGEAKQAQALTVAAILEADAESDNWLISDAHADDVKDANPTRGYVKLGDGADKKDVIAQVDDLLADYPLISAGDISALNDQTAQIFDYILLTVQILLGLAMLIAVIGVVNTLTLSVLERTRELGLLRAVGMSRGQVTRMVAVESMVISLFGAILGMGIGAGLGIALQRAFKDQFVDVLAMPWGTMGFYLVAAILVGLLAALVPASRANKLNVLTAISHD